MLTWTAMLAGGVTMSESEQARTRGGPGPHPLTGRSLRCSCRSEHCELAMHAWPGPSKAGAEAVAHRRPAALVVRIRVREDVRAGAIARGSGLGRRRRPGRLQHTRCWRRSRRCRTRFGNCWRSRRRFRLPSSDRTRLPCRYPTAVIADRACIALYACAARAATAIDARLGAVLDAVIARRRLADVARADARPAIATDAAGLPGRAIRAAGAPRSTSVSVPFLTWSLHAATWQMLPAQTPVGQSPAMLQEVPVLHLAAQLTPAIHGGLAPVLDTVAAGRELADVTHADARQAVAGNHAGLPGIAISALGAAAVGMVSSPFFTKSIAGRRRQEHMPVKHAAPAPEALRLHPPQLLTSVWRLMQRRRTSLGLAGKPRCTRRHRRTWAVRHSLSGSWPFGTLVHWFLRSLAGWRPGKCRIAPPRDWHTPSVQESARALIIGRSTRRHWGGSIGTHRAFEHADRSRTVCCTRHSC